MSAEKGDSVSTSERLLKAVYKTTLEFFSDAVNSNPQTVHWQSQGFGQSFAIFNSGAFFSFIVGQDHLASLRR
jgi:hypothetical protein